MMWLTQMSFHRTAEDLSDLDLRKQIMHTEKIFKSLVSGDLPKSEPLGYAWGSHLCGLAIYGMVSCMEWQFSRGYDDEVFWTFSRWADEQRAAKAFYYVPPPWWEDKDVIRSHRSHLAAANPSEYGGMWPGTPENMPILWPVVDPEDPAVYELRVARADLPGLKSGKLKLPKSIRERVVNL